MPAVVLLQANADQTAADVPEVSIDDEWDNMPPELRAMVLEIQARGR